MSAVLHSLPEQWPQNVWSHIALADAYSHFFAGEYALQLDVGKAIGYLEQGLAVDGRTPDDRDVIQERLAELRKPSYAPRS